MQNDTRFLYKKKREFTCTVWAHREQRGRAKAKQLNIVDEQFRLKVDNLVGNRIEK